MQMMKAAVFEQPGRIVLQERPRPQIGPADALMRVTTTTICGTDVLSQCGGKAMGGWRFGNTIDGCQAEYVLVPNATANRR